MVEEMLRKGLGEEVPREWWFFLPLGSCFVFRDRSPFFAEGTQHELVVSVCESVRVLTHVVESV